MAKAKKQSSAKTSALASRVLKGAKPTVKQTKSLAASVLSQDEKKGGRVVKKRVAKKKKAAKKK